MTELVSSETPVSSTSVPSPPLRAEMGMRALILVIMYSIAAINAVRSQPGVNVDMWWHMSAARWMLQHHAFPHLAIYANLSPQPAWHAYSWLYDFMMYGLYKAFGLVGALGYITVMVLAILTALHRMTGRLQKDFLSATLTALVGILVLMPVFTPRSLLFSVLFFIIQLDLLHRARSSGNWKTLLWLVPLYALWANIHIQFIDGLVVLAATAFEPLLMRFWFWPQKPPISARKLFAILAACIVATWINPYGWELYVSAYKLVSEHVVFNRIQELQAIPFRTWQNFLFLALVAGAAAALARRKTPDLWRWMLFAGGLLVSFRSYRDIWFLTAIAIMILAEELPSKSQARPLPASLRPVIGAAVITVAVVEGLLIGVNNAYLKKVQYEAMPVRAASFVLKKGSPGPIFNNYEWGGYLIWSLQKPVSIDGRAAVYGGKVIKRSLDTWIGQPEWKKNPDLKAANLVIGPAKDALVQLLDRDPDFRQVYHDKTAVVFVRKTPAKPASAR